MRRWICLFLLLVFILSFASARNHSAGDVIIEVDSGVGNITLEEFRNDPDLFSASYDYFDPSSLSVDQHGPSTIWVSMYDMERTFLQALGMRSIHGGSSVYNSYNLPYGHSATEIIFDSDGRSLQWVIENEGFCIPLSCSDLNYECVPEGVDDGCGGSLLGCTGCGVGEICNANGKCGVCVPGAPGAKDCDYLEALNPTINFVDQPITCDSTGNWPDPPCNEYYYWDYDLGFVNPSSCGGTGTRRVECMHRDGSTTTLASDDNCIASAKPASTKVCNCHWEPMDDPWDRHGCLTCFTPNTCTYSSCSNLGEETTRVRDRCTTSAQCGHFFGAPLYCNNDQKCRFISC